MKFIKVHEREDDKTFARYISVRCITHFTAGEIWTDDGNGDECIVYVTEIHTTNEVFYVTETVDEVMRLIERAKLERTA